MNLIEGTTFLVVGTALSVFNFLNHNAIVFINDSNQISATLNPTFSVLLIVGFFFIGVGVTQAAVTLTIYKLEKKLISQKNLKEKYEI